MFDHILVSLDGSSLAECVLPHTVAIAQAFGARVTLLRVMESAHEARSVDPVNWHIIEAEAKAYLDGVAARLQAGGLHTQPVLVVGQPAEQIIEFTYGNNADLIMLSSHGRSGLSGWNVSSVAQKIVLRAHRSIMVVRAYQPAPVNLSGLRYQRVLVPLDGSQRAEVVLPLATHLARAHEAQLLLVHAVRKPEMPRRAPLTQEEDELVTQITERNQVEAAKYLDQLQSRLFVDVQTRLLISDNVTATLHEWVEQEKVDLVVLSAHGYSGGARWPYGSVVISFVAYGSTPLLIMQDLPQDNLERTQAEAAAKAYERR